MKNLVLLWHRTFHNLLLGARFDQFLTWITRRNLVLTFEGPGRALSMLSVLSLLRYSSFIAIEFLLVTPKYDTRHHRYLSLFLFFFLSGLHVQAIRSATLEKGGVHQEREIETAPQHGSSHNDVGRQGQNTDEVEDPVVDILKQRLQQKRAELSQLLQEAQIDSNRADLFLST